MRKTYTLLNLLFFVCLANNIYSQIPTITTFSPALGPIGTTVIITGTNFSTTAASNIVWFGAVQATVTAATSTTLSVTVPTGATYQPITVTVNGLTAYSGSPFNVTFPSSQVINATTFASSVDFTSGTQPTFVAIGDIDGDGKPDLTVANYNSNNISVYRNTSTSGSITASSFLTKVDFSTSTSPNHIAIGDIDGDGKPDLAVTNNNSTVVSVFRNTSTSGSITTASFSSRIDLTVGTQPDNVAISDIDGDGKPDLLVTNNGSNTISIFRNISTSGTITTGSFATKVDLSTGTNPRGMAIGDIDGDGKPEIVVTNFGSNTISIFRNTSAAGSITTGSFAGKADFNTGSGPFRVALGDLDGDGKQDIVVVNTSGNTISTLRNKSTSGSISGGSLETKIDFTTGIAPAGVAISDFDGDGKPDLAVTNYNNTSNNSVSLFRNTSTIGSFSASSFSGKVDFTTGIGSWGVSVGDLDGDGKPDLVIANNNGNTISVIRNTIQTLTAPTLGTITQPTCSVSTGSVVLNSLPATGTWTLTRTPGGTTITGTGISSTISGLATGTYTYTVTNASGVISGVSASVVINSQPATPTAPTVGAITQPTCSVPTGSAVINGLPASGSWTLTQTPGSATTAGTGTSSTISGLSAGTYSYTVTNASGCISTSSSDVIINTQPATPTSPTIGTITQPTCPLPTGSVVLNSLPSTGNWTITKFPGETTTSGTGTVQTISSLAAGTYTFTVTDAEGCISAASADVVIGSIKPGIIPKIRSKWNNILICSNIKDSLVSYQWYKNSTTIPNAIGQFYVTNKQAGLYLVETVDKSGCKNSSNTISISGTKSLSVYPNPASVSFTVKIIGEDEGKAAIAILNSTGIKVMEFQVENITDELLKEIPVNNLDDGIYIIKVMVNNKDLYYNKIVIRK